MAALDFRKRRGQLDGQCTRETKMVQNNGTLPGDASSDASESLIGPRMQVARSAGVLTPLPPDVLLLRSWRGTERLSGLFEYAVELVSEEDPIDPEDLLGQPIALRLDRDDQNERYVHGYVRRFANEGRRGRLHTYRATVVPWLWFLTRTSDCRVFQHRTVPEIIKAVFGDHGVASFETRLTGTYESRAYCVQFNESDFAFVSRLMEEEGIYYYFEHDEEGHRLVLADAPTAHSMSDGAEAIPLRSKQKATSGDEFFWRWSVERNLRPERVALKDYDFKHPRKSMEVRAAAEAPHEMSEYEVFSYPGGYWKAPKGERLARIQMEAIGSDYTVVRAETNSRDVLVGWQFGKLDESNPGDLATYLARSIELRVVSDSFDSGEVPEKRYEIEYTFEATVEAMDSQQSFRPDRVTPRPRMPGPQSAVVVGPKGEEIHTDKFGRVKIQFHWDRYGRKDEDSSCWVRVSQTWAGGDWGGMSIPRIGQEVVVDFYDGDPDRPVITGRVYNRDNMPPEKLPDGKANMSIRSRSYPGGGGFNEICMNDTKGKEGFLIKAQYDHTMQIGHDRNTTVGNDSSEVIGNNRTTEVGVDSAEKVGNNMVLDVGSSLLINAGTSITLKCGASTLHMNQAGVVSISGTMLNFSGSIMSSLTAPVTNVTGGMMLLQNGMLNVSLGVINYYHGAAKGRYGGGQAELNGSGDCVVKGGVVKIN